MNIAVITGASAGIGRELVYAVDKDARYDEIWVIARRKERLEELRDKCTNPIRPIALDLSDLSSIDTYQALLEQEQPEIKMLVNAAGCGVFGPLPRRTARSCSPARSSIRSRSRACATRACRICTPAAASSTWARTLPGSRCRIRRCTVQARAMS